MAVNMHMHVPPWKFAKRYVLSIPSNQPNQAADMDVKVFSLILSIRRLHLRELNLVAIVLYMRT